jgi:putative methionine-R-sulfoxide reductase with GAF domain
MNLIADRAQSVANASGIGIALLEGNQLVHCAGNGSASQIVGSHLTAVLGVSSHHHPRREILRVENAQTDTRIEADICRQFDAQALLMVPIYRDGMMVGVIEILFNEPHQFDEPEVRSYQLMSTLAGDASLLPPERPETVAIRSTVPYALWRMSEIEQAGLVADAPPQVQTRQDSPFVRALASIRRGSKQLSRPRSHFVRTRLLLNYSRHQMEYLQHLRSRITASADFIGRIGNRNDQRVFTWRPGVSRRIQWNAAAVCLVLALAIAAAITRHHSRMPRAADNTAQPETAAVSSQTSPATAEELIPPSEPKARRAAPVYAAGAPSPAFKSMRIGKNEVDYVADDVTIREFRSSPTRTAAHAFARQVNIGEDVTVRYFDSKPNSGGERPVAKTDQALKD